MLSRYSGVLQAAILVLVLVVSTACAGQPAAQPAEEVSAERQLRVLTTTTLVADIVRQVAGDRIEQTVLIPPGVDEHGFQPSPQDIAKAAQADLIFINGAGLETFIEKMIQSAGENVRVIEVSEGIELQEGPGHEDEDELDEEEATEDEHEEGDPHVWTDPTNVILWVNNIEEALSEIDPANAKVYRDNAEQYRQQLRELDTWILEQVDLIPQENRKLVTDHTVFTYFANRYGFEQVGAIIPGYSTLSQPSAQEMAALEDTIREYGVPAIFVGNTVNPSLSERVAQDTQTELVYILTGSLSDRDGPGATYLEYMRYNVQAIVEALK
jgi:ABC-type Zn uptake system ZnuABC Zn-binding protein ZnuA